MTKAKTANQPIEVDYLGEVYRMLETSKYTTVHIARSLDVSERWVHYMRDQEIKEPKYPMVLKLYRFLKAEEKQPA